MNANERQKYENEMMNYKQKRDRLKSNLQDYMKTIEDRKNETKIPDLNNPCDLRPRALNPEHCSLNLKPDLRFFDYKEKFVARLEKEIQHSPKTTDKSDNVGAGNLETIKKRNSELSKSMKVSSGLGLGDEEYIARNGFNNNGSNMSGINVDNTNMINRQNNEYLANQNMNMENYNNNQNNPYYPNNINNNQNYQNMNYKNVDNNYPSNPSQYYPSNYNDNLNYNNYQNVATKKENYTNNPNNMNINNINNPMYDQNQSMPNNIMSSKNESRYVSQAKYNNLYNNQYNKHYDNIYGNALTSNNNINPSKYVDRNNKGNTMEGNINSPNMNMYKSITPNNGYNDYNNKNIENQTNNTAKDPPNNHTNHYTSNDFQSVNSYFYGGTANVNPNHPNSLNYVHEEPQLAHSFSSDQLILNLLNHKKDFKRKGVFFHELKGETSNKAELEEYKHGLDLQVNTFKIMYTKYLDSIKSKVIR